MLVTPYQQPLHTARTRGFLQIGNYQYSKKDLLGEGFSSRVYRGTHKNNQDQVAIKVINTQILTEPIHVTLLESELKILQVLKGCDHVLEMHTIIKESKDTYIVSQMCSTDVSKIILPLLPLETVQKYVHQLLQGFRQLFRKEIIHRDLKPANLLIDCNGNLKIADFGFAIKNSQARTQTKFNIGSPLYMSPEALKRNEYSYKSDIWAIGIIVYEMLTGDTPWQAENEDQLYQKLEKTRIEDLLADQSFPEHLTNLMKRTLQFDRRKRISPEQLILLEVWNKLPHKQNQQEITKIIEKKCIVQKTLFVPRTTKNTKTEKFYKPLNNCPVFSKASNNNVEQPVSIRIKSVTKNIKNTNSLQQNNTQLNVESIVVPDQKQTKETSNSTVKTNGSNTMTAIQDSPSQFPKLTKDEAKAITKNLVYYIHSCRLLYKILLRIDELIENSSNERIVEELSLRRDQTFNEYCKIIVLYLYRLKNFASNNFLNLSSHHHEDYIISGQYKKIRKASGDYIEKYSKSQQLKDIWIQRQPHNFANCITLTTQIIQQLWPQLCQKNHNEIILLEFLIYTHQVLSALEKGSYNYVVNKDQIEDYVDTIPNPPSFNRFKHAIAGAKKICRIVNAKN